ncbi:hypothetical protein EVAR_74332_1 [Eumeta japonica]|uniref:Uncharacterized protein n=1 Tax=Eumeta variegata TaxID=151549 RepID=A0A4C1SDP7_EUMVA|nr:hypothetical protein EVAR_74332_1 [Eumeta japonica]
MHENPAAANKLSGEGGRAWTVVVDGGGGASVGAGGIWGGAEVRVPPEKMHQNAKSRLEKESRAGTVYETRAGTGLKSWLIE